MVLVGQETSELQTKHISRLSYGPVHMTENTQFYARTAVDNSVNCTLL